MLNIDSLCCGGGGGSYGRYTAARLFADTPPLPLRSAAAGVFVLLCALLLLIRSRNREAAAERNAQVKDGAFCSDFVTFNVLLRSLFYIIDDMSRLVKALSRDAM